MIYSFGSGISPAAIQRGRLKHSWLENEVLNKSPERVVMLRRKYGWPALRAFPENAQQALVLAIEVEFGFSPAKFVDECAPLAALPEDQRKAIGLAVHAAYLKCFDAHGAARRLRDAADRIKVALSLMLIEWNKPDDMVSDAELAMRWLAVLGAAEHLRAVLDALPKGIVLP